MLRALSFACFLTLSIASPVAAGELTAETVRAALAAASPEHKADFSGKSLERLDLSGLDLRRATLAGADLYGANLVGADLRGVDLDRKSTRLNSSHMSISYAVF